MKRSIICSCMILGVWNAAAQEAASVSGKTIMAVGYQVDSGRTTVDLKGTPIAPGAIGEAKVEAKKSITNIEAEVKNLPQPGKLGTEFLTYVLWAVSPEGRSSNLGEILIDKQGNGKVEVTTQLQTFSLILSAEPYFTVRQPSELVVLENQTRKNTKGKLFPVNDYKLMKRAQYQKMGNPLALSLDTKTVPLEMYEARNAMEIAKSRNADKYAPEIFSKAEGGLKMAENQLASKAERKTIIATARQTVQFAEDSRALAVQRQEEERIAAEKKAAADRARAEAETKAAAEAAEAKRRSDLEAKRQAELAAAREAQLKAESEAAALRAKNERERAAAQAAAEAAALKAKEDAAKAEAARAKKAAENLRASLLAQFNRILETRDTPRGLVVNMADVLFDTGKYNLRSEAREKLARFSGVVLGYPSLNLSVEGHTDSTGSDELNQKLSEQRAHAVRTYLQEQGVPPANLTAQGFGKSMPVADNGTAAGRQQNRRVEIIVSGEVIGTQIGK